MTKFKGTPLFGPDSSPQNTSQILGLAGTFIFWLLFLIIMIVIKPAENKPKYKDVQIVLSSTPVKQKTEEAPAPAQAASQASSQPQVQEVVETPKVVEPPKSVETPKKAETPKTEPVKPKTEVAKPKSEPVKTKSEPVKAKTEPVKAQVPVSEPIEYAMDMTDFSFSAPAKTQSAPVFNWDDFEEESEDSMTDTTDKYVSEDYQAFSGSAASQAESTSQSIKSSSTRQTVSKEVTGSTSQSLKNISNQRYMGNASNGVESETNVKTAVSGSGKIAMEMSNGSSRVLIDPKEPKINLSEEASSSIDSSKTVKIRFRVVEVGNVPQGEIEITPASILTEIVRREIIEQISKWRFEAADYTAYAEFEYKIVKK